MIYKFIPGVFSPQECLAIIEQAEAAGLSAASVAFSSGAQVDARIRNNDRVNFTDTQLLATWWQRLQAQLPVVSTWGIAAGLNPALRVYRYLPGQRFKAHKDGVVHLPDGSQTRLTALLYLNDVTAGGETLLLPEGPASAVSVPIPPQCGAVLLFEHRCWHEGATLQSGRKYVLRTDVIYSNSI